MTKYRQVNYSGYNDYLQYEKEITVLGLFKIKFWRGVWRPFYDRIKGRQDLGGFGWNNYVNSYTDDLEKFVKRWPEIDKYFEWAKEEQKRLEQEVAKYWADLKAKKGIKAL